MIPAKVLWLGRQKYAAVWHAQKELMTKVRSGEEPDTLILVEHDPVITLGRSAKREHILVSAKSLAREGIELFEVERGGDVTYHGPGQLVGYPILDLKRHGRDLHLLLRNYEEVLLRTLVDFGIQGRRFPGYTGVWVADEKIAAIGVAVEHWITYHGFAFNVAPNLHHFQLIVPCGIADYGVTSLEQILGQAPDLATVRERVIEHFAQVFGVKWTNDGLNGI
ncbi:MAG: lipoyl(octanoyl) transferase LipB [Firmicutes bacterium]|jgi:lipoyl(octanoyl) transferase|nr:lipoyl(octanoyl) transferase LipB [Bacillota bacterium]